MYGPRLARWVRGLGYGCLSEAVFPLEGMLDEFQFVSGGEERRQATMGVLALEDTSGYAQNGFGPARFGTAFSGRTHLGGFSSEIALEFIPGREMEPDDGATQSH